MEKSERNLKKSPIALKKNREMKFFFPLISHFFNHFKTLSLDYSCNRDTQIISNHSRLPIEFSLMCGAEVSDFDRPIK